MNLALYSLGDWRDGIPWKEFRAAFASCEIEPDPKLDQEVHWVLKNSVRDIRFYAPVTGVVQKTTVAVHFEYDDLVELRHDDGCPDHPIWRGLFEVLRDRRALLHVKPPGMGTPVAQAVVVVRPELLEELPSWVDELELRFAAPTFEEFRKVITAGWQLSRRFLARSEPRLGWAEAGERDEEARAAFLNFMMRKRGPRPRYTWLDKSVKLTETSGSFLDVYGTWVDWRELDDSVVRYFAKRLKTPESLSADEHKDVLRMRFQSRTKELSIEDVGKDRYNTIRAVNELLSPEYEVRVVRGSMDSDTHCFLIAPRWLWQDLETQCGDQLRKKVKPVEATDSFV